MVNMFKYRHKHGHIGIDVFDSREIEIFAITDLVLGYSHGN